MAYLPDRNIPVIVQVRNALEAMLALAKATGTVVLGAAPVDGNDLVLNNGVTERTLNFVDTLTGAAEEVLVAATIAGTLANLIEVINTDQDNPDEVIDPRPGLWAVDAEQGTPTVTITNTVVGTVGNVVITKTGSFTVTGMSGGVDATSLAEILNIGDINIGANIGLLDSDENEISPATEDMQDALIAVQNPTVVDPRASANTGASWTEINIPDGAVFVLFRVMSADAFVVPTADASDPADGVAWPVNGVYKIGCAGYNDGNGKLHIKQVASAGSIQVTFYGN